MIFQIAVGATGSIVQPVPFQGLCKVKVIKIDYIFDTAAAINQQLISIRSNTLINTPLSGNILFFNTSNPYFGKNFELPDIYLAGQIDFTLRVFPDSNLPAGAGGYTNCLITLDIEPQY